MRLNLFLIKSDRCCSGRRYTVRWILTIISESTPAILLVDHVALGVPAFVPIIPIDLHELLENGIITHCVFRGKTSGVVGMTIDIVLYSWYESYRLKTVGRTEHVKCSTWYFLSGKVSEWDVYMSEIRRTACRYTRIALRADEIQPSEIISFT